MRRTGFILRIAPFCYNPERFLFFDAIREACSFSGIELMTQRLFTITCLTVLAVAALARVADASFVVFNSSDFKARRYRGDSVGVLAASYFGNFGQEDTLGYVPSSDQRFMYLLTSSLGHIDEVVPFNLF